MYLPFEYRYLKIVTAQTVKTVYTLFKFIYSVVNAWCPRSNGNDRTAWYSSKSTVRLASCQHIYSLAKSPSQQHVHVALLFFRQVSCWIASISGNPSFHFQARSTLCQRLAPRPSFHKCNEHWGNFLYISSKCTLENRVDGQCFKMLPLIDR